jgi:hypothetical protein
MADPSSGEAAHTGGKLKETILPFHHCRVQCGMVTKASKGHHSRKYSMPCWAHISPAKMSTQRPQERPVILSLAVQRVDPPDRLFVLCLSNQKLLFPEFEFFPPELSFES